jgi:hypothetical protein
LLEVDEKGEVEEVEGKVEEEVEEVVEEEVEEEVEEKPVEVEARVREDYGHAVEGAFGNCNCLDEGTGMNEN